MLSLCSSHTPACATERNAALGHGTPPSQAGGPGQLPHKSHAMCCFPTRSFVPDQEAVGSALPCAEKISVLPHPAALLQPSLCLTQVTAVVAKQTGASATMYPALSLQLVQMLLDGRYGVCARNPKQTRSRQYRPKTLS